MLLRVVTILAFAIFLFTILSIGLKTPGGLFVKHIISSIPLGDKSLHFLLLTLLTFLLNSSLRQRKVNLQGYQLLTGSLLIAAGITLEECSQAFIPTRNFELMDMLCNYAGIYAGGLLPCFLNSKYNTYADDERSKTLSFQAIHHRTGPVQHESRYGWRSAGRLGRRGRSR